MIESSSENIKNIMPVFKIETNNESYKYDFINVDIYKLSLKKFMVLLSIDPYQLESRIPFNDILNIDIEYETKKTLRYGIPFIMQNMDSFDISPQLIKMNYDDEEQCWVSNIFRITSNNSIKINDISLKNDNCEIIQIIRELKNPLYNKYIYFIKLRIMHYSKKSMYFTACTIGCNDRRMNIPVIFSR